eukprot:m51a1_g11574 hypothetical protein (872) ;mRNA; f:21914-25173
MRRLRVVLGHDIDVLASAPEEESATRQLILALPPAVSTAADLAGYLGRRLHLAHDPHALELSVDGFTVPPAESVDVIQPEDVVLVSVSRAAYKRLSMTLPPSEAARPCKRQRAEPSTCPRPQQPRPSSSALCSSTTPRQPSSTRLRASSLSTTPSCAASAAPRGRQEPHQEGQSERDEHEPEGCAAQEEPQSPVYVPGSSSSSSSSSSSGGAGERDERDERDERKGEAEGTQAAPRITAFAAAAAAALLAQSDEETGQAEEGAQGREGSPEYAPASAEATEGAQRRRRKAEIIICDSDEEGEDDGAAEGRRARAEDGPAHDGGAGEQEMEGLCEAADSADEADQPAEAAAAQGHEAAAAAVAAAAAEPLVDEPELQEREAAEAAEAEVEETSALKAEEKSAAEAGSSKGAKSSKPAKEEARDRKSREAAAATAAAAASEEAKGSAAQGKKAAAEAKAAKEAAPAQAAAAEANRGGGKDAKAARQSEAPEKQERRAQKSTGAKVSDTEPEEEEEGPEGTSDARPAAAAAAETQRKDAVAAEEGGNAEDEEDEDEPELPPLCISFCDGRVASFIGDMRREVTLTVDVPPTVVAFMKPSTAVVVSGSKIFVWDSATNDVPRVLQPLASDAAVLEPSDVAATPKLLAVRLRSTNTISFYGMDTLKRLGSVNIDEASTDVTMAFYTDTGLFCAIPSVLRMRRVWADGSAAQRGPAGPSSLRLHRSEGIGLQLDCRPDVSLLPLGPEHLAVASPTVLRVLARSSMQELARAELFPASPEQQQRRAPLLRAVKAGTFLSWERGSTTAYLWRWDKGAVESYAQVVVSEGCATVAGAGDVLWMATGCDLVAVDVGTGATIAELTGATQRQAVTSVASFVL